MARRGSKPQRRSDDHRTDARERALILLYEADTKGIAPAVRKARAAGIVVGLILNFASMPLTIKRVGPGRYSDS